MTQETAVGYLDRTIRHLDYTTEDLIRRAANLRDDMDALVKKLTADPYSRTINELGEVQGRGFDVDRLCAVRHELLQMVLFLDPDNV